jgi:peptidyl-prolyl cis-trans isomerase SurA
MEPAIREYLTKMREDAHIDIKTGYADTGASPNKRVLPIAYSAYVPPSSKKKRKVERTRFRDTGKTFRQKSTPVAMTSDTPAASVATAKADAKADKKKADLAMTPGKKEKIRFGKAPQETLPNTPTAQTEDAGAVTNQTTASAAQTEELVNPLEAQPERKKTRYSARAREPKQPKKSLVVQQQKEAITPVAPETAEVADRQTQSSALGLKGDTSKKKKKATATGEKTRMSERPKSEEQKDQTPQQPTPIPAVKGAPAPADAPQQPAQQPASTPQQ